MKNKREPQCTHHPPNALLKNKIPNMRNPMNSPQNGHGMKPDIPHKIAAQMAKTIAYVDMPADRRRTVAAIHAQKVILTFL